MIIKQQKKGAPQNPNEEFLQKRKAKQEINNVVKSLKDKLVLKKIFHQKEVDSLVK